METLKKKKKLNMGEQGMQSLLALKMFFKVNQRNSQGVRDKLFTSQI